MWGATSLYARRGRHEGFNPRTRVGCDMSTGAGRSGSRFQSTHPCGVRHDIASHRATRRAVSIHAPVWGATHQTTKPITRAKFQSTHPCGVRRVHDYRMGFGIGFQSTHPCGVRPGVMGSPMSAVGVSIHAPVWGAT